MKLILRKQGHALVAQDRLAIDDVEAIKEGALVTCEVKRSRSIQHHRRFFAVVRFCFENQREPVRYLTEDAMRAALTISAGHRTELYMADGTVAYMANSIAWEAMDQTAFNEFWARVCDAIKRHYVPGITDEHIRRGLMDLIGEAA
jgi:hypothetical protein